MSLVLEGAHPLQREPAPDVDVGRGDVDPELDAERPSERQLLLELACRQHVDGVARELDDSHGRATLDGARILPALFGRRGEPKRRRRRIRKLRLLVLVLILLVLGTASFSYGLVTAVASEIPTLDPARYHRVQNSYIYAGNGADPRRSSAAPRTAGSSPRARSRT